MSRRFARLAPIGAMALPAGASAQVTTLASANPVAVAMAPLGTDAFPWGAVDHGDRGKEAGMERRGVPSYVLEVDYPLLALVGIMSNFASATFEH